MASEIDASCTSHDAAGAIGSDDIAARKAERDLVVSALDVNAVPARSNPLNKVAAPDVYTELQRTLLE
jgi:hypothetical protein